MTITNTIKTSLNTTAQNITDAINELEAEGLQDKYDKGRIITLIDELTVRDVGSTQMFNLYSEDKGGEIGVENTVSFGNIATTTMGLTADIISVNGDTTVNGNFETDATTVDLVATGTNTISGATVDINGNIDADGTTIDLNATGALNLAGSPVSINGISQTPNQITTADDSSESIYSNDEKEHVLNGSGDNFKVLFKDSEAGKLWSVGQSKTVFNNSSEVAIVTDDNASFFEFLMPFSTAKIICTAGGIGTTTFEYADDANGYRRYTTFFADFITTYSLASSELATASSGGGTSAFEIGGIDNGAGLFKLGAGTSTATGYGQLYNNRAKIKIGNGAVVVCASVTTAALPDATDDFIFELGLTNTAGTTATNEIVFRLDRTNTNYWYGRTKLSSVSTDVASTITASITGYDKLCYVVSSDKTKVCFYVNNAYIGSSSTNIPTADISILAQTVGVAGTGANRYVVLDYIGVKKYNPGGR